MPIQYKKICVVTAHGLSEPRGVRHALAAKIAYPEAEIVFLFYKSEGGFSNNDKLILEQLHGINCQALTFPIRDKSLFKWVALKAIFIFSKIMYKYFYITYDTLFSFKVYNLRNILIALKADLYFAHNFETLRPASAAAKINGSHYVFDCMEYYSDMGDGQPAALSKAIHEIEASELPAARLITTSSDELVDAYKNEYGLAAVISSYNCPKVLKELPKKIGGPLNLYWRNSVIGFGQRGLEDIFTVLQSFPEGVMLYLQGQLGIDGGSSLRSKISDLGIGKQVIVLDPHLPGEAVASASRFDIGLCLERSGPRNHDLTVSNKLFDYHMAGLAVVASNLDGLRAVLQRSGAGLLYEPGNIDGLRKQIARLLDDSVLLKEKQASARKFALSDANYDLELENIAGQLRRIKI